MSESSEKKQFETGDKVTLNGNSDPFVIVTIQGDVAHCTPLPYQLGEAVLVVSAAQLVPWTGELTRKGRGRVA